VTYVYDARGLWFERQPSASGTRNGRTVTRLVALVGAWALPAVIAFSYAAQRSASEQGSRAMMDGEHSRPFRAESLDAPRGHQRHETAATGECQPPNTFPPPGPATGTAL
jgi:hypothetical protein